MGFIRLAKFPERWAGHTVPTTKVCKGCPGKGEQPLDKFPKHKGASDSYGSKCKACVNAEYEQKKKDRDMMNPF